MGPNHDEEMCGPILMYYPKKVLSSDLDQSGYFSVFKRIQSWFKYIIFTTIMYYY